MEQNMPSGLEYEEVCRRLIKAEMAKRDLHWDDVAKELQCVGICLSSANLRRMFSMGTIRASVLLALIDLYGIDTATSKEIRHYIETIRRYPVGAGSTQTPEDHSV
jgi:Zn-dependent oligopeptidase